MITDLVNIDVPEYNSSILIERKNLDILFEALRTIQKNIRTVDPIVVEESNLYIDIRTTITVNTYHNSTHLTREGLDSIIKELQSYFIEK